MICRKELREQLIKRIIELYKQAKTVSIDDKICVTLLLDAEDAWEHKKRCPGRILSKCNQRL